MNKLVIYPAEEKGVNNGDDRHWCSLEALRRAGLSVDDLYGFYNSDAPADRQGDSYEVSDSAWYEAPGSPDQQRWRLYTRTAGLLDKLKQDKEGASNG